VRDLLDTMFVKLYK